MYGPEYTSAISGPPLWLGLCSFLKAAAAAAAA